MSTEQYRNTQLHSVIPFEQITIGQANDLKETFDLVVDGDSQQFFIFEKTLPDVFSSIH